MIADYFADGEIVGVPDASVRKQVSELRELLRRGTAKWADAILALVNGSVNDRVLYRVLRNVKSSDAVLAEIRADPSVIAEKSRWVAKYYLQSAYFHGVNVPLDALRSTPSFAVPGTRFPSRQRWRSFPSCGRR
jgi:hypothetical protein